MHGLVGRDGPESVEVDVDGQQPHYEGQRCKLGFEADGHQDDEGSSHHVLQNLQKSTKVNVCGGMITLCYMLLIAEMNYIKITGNLV